MPLQCQYAILNCEFSSWAVKLDSGSVSETGKKELLKQEKEWILISIKNLIALVRTNKNNERTCTLQCMLGKPKY